MRVGQLVGWVNLKSLSRNVFFPTSERQQSSGVRSSKATVTTLMSYRGDHSVSMLTQKHIGVLCSQDGNSDSTVFLGSGAG